MKFNNALSWDPYNDYPENNDESDSSESKKSFDYSKRE